MIDLKFLPLLILLLKLIQLVLSDRFVEVPQLVQLSLSFLEFGHFEFLLIPVLDLVVQVLVLSDLLLLLLPLLACSLAFLFALVDSGGSLFLTSFQCLFLFFKSFLLFEFIFLLLLL